MKKTIIFTGIILLFVLSAIPLFGQAEDFTAVRAEVDFESKLRVWDGFGFNYVETAQTMDYDEYPQDYGGFSILDEKSKQEIIELVFGEEGLRVGLVKMFLDPFHQVGPDAPFDHKTTTANMREFVRMGLAKTRERYAELTIITTLYGPPAYCTKQNIMRGRDLDPEHKEDLANYMVDWVRFLKKKENVPVKYLSLHNEGESWLRWTVDGKTDYPGHDYNLFWPPEQVVEYIIMLPALLDRAGVGDVGVTPGETTNWYRFGTWGYADYIAGNADALMNLGLITSHGFYGGSYGRWFGEHKSTGIDQIRAKRPDIHSWVTSTSWSNMDAKNIKEMHGNIYTAKNNGIIPWAGIQRPPHWVKGDPNPGSAFTVHEDGTYEVRRGYYYYKQITRAGQPGMAVAQTMAMDSEIAVIAFASNGTDNSDAFVVINIASDDRKVAVKVSGTISSTFEAYRTVDMGNRYKNLDYELYAPIGEYEVNNDGQIIYLAPAGSVATFFGKQ